MKKLLILFVALFSIVGTMPGYAAKRNIMELPIFERLVIIVKHYETLHNGLTTWPYYPKKMIIQRLACISRITH